MAKSVTVTITVTCQVEVPKSWNEDKIQEKTSEVLLIDVKSSNSKVVIVDQEMPEYEIEAEED